MWMFLCWTPAVEMTGLQRPLFSKDILATCFVTKYMGNILNFLIT
uniref:Uncharacterized protein MANES_02G092400 n=1 Tax=Rhizophora mucronata TaxID=61149 RepID=A0A2P2PBC8_RHIMU